MLKESQIVLGEGSEGVHPLVREALASRRVQVARGWRGIPGTGEGRLPEPCLGRPAGSLPERMRRNGLIARR